MDSISFSRHGKHFMWALIFLLTSPLSFAQDSDGDGIPDINDNCLQASNPSQFDADADLFGNACDADFDNNGIVNFLDIGFFASAFSTTNPLADLDGNGIVNFLDFARIPPLFFLPPGPSASGASYAANVQPVLMAKCAPCHTGLGLGGHNLAVAYADSFLTTSNVNCGSANVGQCSIIRVQSGQMPNGAGCTGNPILDAGNVSCLTYPEQLALFSWVNGGLSP